MKNILKKLAALADQADADGHIKAANKIDELIKVFAEDQDAWDVVGEELDKQHLEDSKRGRDLEFAPVNVTATKPKTETLDMSGETGLTTIHYNQKGKTPAQIAKETREQHEKALKKIQQIAEGYTKNNKPVPFKVPSPGKNLGREILAVLQQAGKGQPLKSWQDLHKRLDDIDKASTQYIIGMEDSDIFKGSPDTMLAKK